MNIASSSSSLPRALGLLLLASLATVACQSAPTAEVKSSAALMKEIQAEIGDAACDGPQHCRTIAVGSKACGGPDAYLAWSSKRSGDGSKIKSLAASHTAARSQENLRSGMSSNCAVVTNPGARCEAGQCRLQAAGAGGAQPTRPD